MAHYAIQNTNPCQLQITSTSRDSEAGKHIRGVEGNIPIAITGLPETHQ